MSDESFEDDKKNLDPEVRVTEREQLFLLNMLLNKYDIGGFNRLDYAECNCDDFTPECRPYLYFREAGQSSKGYIKMRPDLVMFWMKSDGTKVRTNVSLLHYNFFCGIFAAFKLDSVLISMK